MASLRVSDRLRIVFGKLVVFFLVVSLLLLLLYALGSYQDFLDSSQLWLLRMLRITLGAVVFCGAYAAALIVVGAFTRGRFLALRFAFTMLAVVVCAAVLLLLTFLSAWFTGSQ